MNKGQKLNFPTVSYVKRIRMTIDFRAFPDAARGPTPLPRPFVWIPWHTCLTDIHGRVKYLAFRHSYDAKIFPSFRRFDGCINLMRSIAAHSGFISRGTWLIARVKDGACVPVNERGEYQILSRKPDSEPLDYVATIQGVQNVPGLCNIQNVAVIPEYQGLGLGRRLLQKGLQGFKEAGCSRVSLEVTSGNLPAIRLYESAGFEVLQTLYKETYLQ